jgi:flagellar basal-body rod protein FlgB
MLDRFLDSIQFQGQALRLRADRQKVLAGNSANADTAGIQVADFNFAWNCSRPPNEGWPIRRAGAGCCADWTPWPVAQRRTDPKLQYRLPEQASIDGNTVELDREAPSCDNLGAAKATLRSSTAVCGRCSRRSAANDPSARPPLAHRV